MAESRAEYTNRIAQEPARGFKKPRKNNSQLQCDDTLRIHAITRKVEIKQGWSEIKNPIENVTGVHRITQKPMNVHCVWCDKDVITELQYVSGGLTWIVSCIVASFGGVFGCCLLPFYIKAVKDVVHCCPKCHASLAVHYRI